MFQKRYFFIDNCMQFSKISVVTLEVNYSTSTFVVKGTQEYNGYNMNRSTQEMQQKIFFCNSCFAFLGSILDVGQFCPKEIKVVYNPEI
jgi:hypothetical protein